MSGQPFGDQNTTAFQPPKPGPIAGDSPELLSRANSAFNLAIGAIAVTFLCCCGIAGLIMGIMAMNNAGSVLAIASPGSEASAKASTAKMVAIIAIVLSVIHMLGSFGIGIGNMGR